jgi:hypothetical protein
MRDNVRPPKEVSLRVKILIRQNCPDESIARNLIQTSEKPMPRPFVHQWASVHSRRYPTRISLAGPPRSARKGDLLDPQRGKVSPDDSNVRGRGNLLSLDGDAVGEKRGAGSATWISHCTRCNSGSSWCRDAPVHRDRNQRRTQTGDGRTRPPPLDQACHHPGAHWRCTA